MISIPSGARSVGSRSPVKLRTFPVVGSSIAIGKRWREFQGCNNWDGLLVPLDDALRSEILRYGGFVQAAYTCFDFDPSSPSYGNCLYPKSSLLRCSGLPETGYSVSSNLTATSGVGLPSNFSGAAPAWLSRRSSWIGYVAVCKDEDVIRRLGRRDIVISYRGTATCYEWLENFRAQLTHLPSSVMPTGKLDAQPEAMVEHGFWSLFTSPCSAVGRSLRDEVRQEVQRLVKAYGSNDGKPISITVVGHSLGAALAVLTAYDITTTSLKDDTPSPTVTVVSFGGPRVGNASFRRRLEGMGIKVLRIVNTHDIVTRVPGFVEAESSQPSKWLLAKTGWVYADIGEELRIGGERPAGNVAACHDLNVYLELVNQLREKCPFRKLMQESRPAIHDNIIQALPFVKYWVGLGWIFIFGNYMMQQCLNI